MSEQWAAIAKGLGQVLITLIGRIVLGIDAAWRAVVRVRAWLIVLTLLGLVGYGLYKYPPLETIDSGEIGIRSNQLFGGVAEFHEGPVLVVPGVHRLRHYSLRDRIYRPAQNAQASEVAPFQSMEGLSVGVEMTVRYALDPTQIMGLANRLPDDIDGQVVAPEVQGVIYKVLTSYTVKEIYSTKRSEIQQAIETQLKPRLAADGILLRGVQMGRVDLPADYRAGMERLLAEELENERMRYTLQLKDQQVKQSELEAEAEKVRREKAAEAAGNEEVIAARAQEEAMKHVLPFKQKQIEQRRLEAEADKLARIKAAEASAEARRIEAEGEAASRQKLADAEAYRLDRIGKITSEQMERDGALLSKHPLLIQKTMADKLSDKVSVIIAPPPAGGGFIGSTLLGQSAAAATNGAAASEAAARTENE
jgi:regulator of protease activity HflC (stomatin/prohibitin superfamily)